uniref:Uncharacterized protein n=1 Tax=Aegilops tauschii subsp. strangulata TaxID=200361 RepID=A0A453GHJ7_AEGTS
MWNNRKVNEMVEHPIDAPRRRGGAEQTVFIVIKPAVLGGMHACLESVHEALEPLLHPACFLRPKVVVAVVEAPRARGRRAQPPSQFSQFVSLVVAVVGVEVEASEQLRVHFFILALPVVVVLLLLVVVVTVVEADAVDEHARHHLHFPRLHCLVPLTLLAVGVGFRLRDHLQHRLPVCLLFSQHLRGEEGRRLDAGLAQAGERAAAVEEAVMARARQPEVTAVGWELVLVPCDDRGREARKGRRLSSSIRLISSSEEDGDGWALVVGDGLKVAAACDGQEGQEEHGEGGEAGHGGWSRTSPVD